VLLTVDIGTSRFKSAVWDFEGESICRTAFAAVPLSHGLSDGPHHETDSGQWLNAFEDCCRNLSRSVPLAAVEAIVISGNGPTLVPVLKAKTASPHSSFLISHSSFLPARLWLDRRAEEAAGRVSALLGGFVDAGFFLPKALDIMTNEPGLYEKTVCFLGCPELLAYALTGEARTVFPSDGFDRWYWNDGVLERLGLDKGKFPPFIRPGEIFGPLTPQVAARLGFKPGIPIIAGGPDFFAAILGTGTVKPGRACDRTGTSEGVNACTENRIADGRLMSYSHPVKPFWNLSGIISTTGKAVEWARGLLGLETYGEFYTLAETARAGAGGVVFLPYLAGERAPVWNPRARGALRGLGLSTGRAEFARSVLEGVCFAIRDIVYTMEEAGAAVNELRVAGAASGNATLNRLKADIPKKKILTPVQKESERLGLAVIGSCALGTYASFAEAAGDLVRIDETLLPDTENAALYDDLLAEYLKITESGL
jgi:xylulokinase